MLSVVLVLLASLVYVYGEPARNLYPFQQLTGELVLLNGAGNRYFLNGLKPSTGYEVRVSHPASIPSSVSIELEAEDLQKRHRKLLDCDKLILFTGPLGTVKGQGQGQPVVVVKARRRSIHRDGPLAGPDHLVYNIVLAELVLGLPTDTLPVIGAVALLVVAVILLTPSWSRKLLPALLEWIIEQGPQEEQQRPPSASNSGGAGRSKRPVSESAAPISNTKES